MKYLVVRSLTQSQVGDLPQRYDLLKDHYNVLLNEKRDLQQAFEDVLEQVDQFSSKMEGIGMPASNLMP